jgi:hypothetical protein
MDCSLDHFPANPIAVGICCPTIHSPCLAISNQLAGVGRTSPDRSRSRGTYGPKVDQKVGRKGL